MTASALDGIAGLGETRRKRLVKELGGVNAVKRASLEQLQALTWLPDAWRPAIHERFRTDVGGADGAGGRRWSTCPCRSPGSNRWTWRSSRR